MLPRSILLPVGMALLCGCDGASSDPGTRAWLVVGGAQFAPGPLPVGADTGPHVDSVQNPLTTVHPGQRALPLRGSLDLSARSVALGLKGDMGFWILPAAPPSYETPGLLSFEAPLEFAQSLPPGPLELDVAAGGAAGVFGPAVPIALVAEAVPPPEGTLVITLRWDTEADLDLHVVDPKQTEIWAGNINSYMKPPVGETPDPMAVASGGILDYDSNAGCQIDGRLVEDLIYTQPPPSGHFLVRVDTFSLCGEAVAHWTVEARRMGQLFASAHGTSTEFDTRGGHGLGAGVLAMEFDQP